MPEWVGDTSWTEATPIVVFHEEGKVGVVKLPEKSFPDPLPDISGRGEGNAENVSDFPSFRLFF